ncbi:MAG: hypothetical protein IPG61_05020 [bacterium]|jgi:hypothetical protein|nr:hypothetical protein [bacterium]
MRSIVIIALATAVLLVPPASAIAASAAPLVLGGEDEQEGMLLSPEQVEEGPDGNLYVLDTGDATIKVYGPTGEYRYRLGGEGEGPGRFQRADGASFGFIGKDRIYFAEYYGGHHWLTIMKLNGDLVRVLSPQLDVAFGVAAASPLRGGGFLVQFGFNVVAHAKDSYFLYDTPRSLARIDSLGAVVSTIVKTSDTRSISTLPNGGESNLPFTPGFHWLPLDDDEVLWTNGMSPRLRVLDHAGRLVREIETQLPGPVPVSSQELGRWRAEHKELVASRYPDWWNRYGRVIESYDKPLYDKPIIERISRTPGGLLLIEGPPDSGSALSSYRLINDRGEILARTTTLARGLHLSAHYVLYFTTDEDGAVSAHAAVRAADEAAAVAQFR